MPLDAAKLDPALSAIDAALADLRGKCGPLVQTAIDRWRSDAQAIRFHLRPDSAGRPPLTAIVGGTGTGKSTLANRITGANLTATSYRRTFTSGAVAIVADPGQLPPEWLSIEHRRIADIDIPARGQADALAVVREDRPLTRVVSLIDTPDLDGDQPLHHAQAERVFRWAQAVVFAVTPEKYQMTELLPYYRLARRYGVPALFVMNKAEESAVVEDFRAQLAQRDWTDAQVFAVPRDDAAWEPPREWNLEALRSAIEAVRLPDQDVRNTGLARRSADLLNRFQDQILAPLRRDRTEVDGIASSIRALETPGVGLDVNPITEQLQKRLQQRSVLYLMGPQRILERVRQVPGMLLRLPRTVWDVVARGQGVRLKDPSRPAAGSAQAAPDFRAALTEQFQVIQSRIEDVLRSSKSGLRWVESEDSRYMEARLDPAEAGRVAAEELGELERWLEQRWNATPRDTLLLMRLLKHLPGGEKLTKWTEAAPYLLAVVVATQHTLFGPVDLLVLGGFSLATWLSEKLSNEVAQRTRAANRRIAERFSDLAHSQITRILSWLDGRAPSLQEIEKVEKLADALYAVAGEAN